MSIAVESGAEVIAGRVTDSRGNAVSSVDIDVDDAASGVRLPVDARSNDSGFYFLEVPPGLYHVNFDAPIRKGLVSKRIHFVNVAGDTPLDVTLSDGVLLDGFVLDPDGNGVAGVDVDVDVASTGERVRTPFDETDASGHFSLVVPAGSLHLSFAPPSGSGLAPVQLTDEPVLGNTSLTVRLAAGVRLGGHVLDADGRDVAGADLDLTELAGGRRVPLHGDRTDASGEFEVTLVPGRYRIAVIPPPATGLAAALFLDVAVRRDTSILVLVRTGAQVTAIVRTVLDAPVVNADLDFVGPDGYQQPVWNDRTGIGGEVQVVLPLNEYTVSVTPPPGSGLAALTGEPLSVSGPMTVEWLLESRATETGLRFAGIAPNPARGPLELRLAAADGISVDPKVTVFDVRGRIIGQIAMRRVAGGAFSGLWTGRDSGGRSLGTGIYFLIAESGAFRARTRIVWAP